MTKSEFLTKFDEVFSATGPIIKRFTNCHRDDLKNSLLEALNGRSAEANETSGNQQSGIWQSRGQYLREWLAQYGEILTSEETLVLKKTAEMSSEYLQKYQAN